MKLKFLRILMKIAVAFHSKMGAEVQKISENQHNAEQKEYPGSINTKLYSRLTVMRTMWQT